MRAKRPIAEPNPGFMIQLKAFEKVIFGVISDVPIVSPKKVAEGVAKCQGDEEIASEDKEITDGIQLMKIQGDTEGAREIEEQLSHV